MHVQWESLANEHILGGVSGSPIINKAGEAIGMVCVGSSTSPREGHDRDHGPNPCLRGNLPGWMLFKPQRRRQPLLSISGIRTSISGIKTFDPK